MTANSYDNSHDQGTIMSYRANQDIRKTEETELKNFNSPEKLTLTAREQPYVLRQSVDQLKDQYRYVNFSDLHSPSQPDAN